ncbi:MAG: OmpA family protein [Fibrobacterales bacterium]
MSQYSDSPSKSLDHSIFSDDYFKGRASGGGVMTHTTSATSSTYDNSPSSTATKPRPQEEEEEKKSTTQNQELVEEQEEPQEPLVKLSNIQFLTPDSVIIDEKTEVQVDVTFLTEVKPREVVFQINALFDGKIESSQQVTGAIRNSVARATVPVHLHHGYYFKENKALDEKIAYTVAAVCPRDNTEIESETLKLPRKSQCLSLVEVNSAVFNQNGILPSLDENNYIIKALCASYRYMKEWPDKEITIYGHADTTGSADSDFEVSLDRAQAVKALLAGDSALWKSIAKKSGTVFDYQRYLKFLSLVYGWNTDPGTVDGKTTEQTASALQQFQDEYNQKYNKSIDVDGFIGPDTWGAFLDIIRDKALTGADASAQSLKPLFYKEHNGLFPCGSLYPISNTSIDGFHSDSDSRVEIQFHDRPNPPKLPKASAQMETSEISPYDALITTMEIIPLDSAILEDWTIEELNDDDDEADYEAIEAEETTHWIAEVDHDDDDDSEIEHKTPVSEQQEKWHAIADDDDDDEEI